MRSDDDDKDIDVTRDVPEWEQPGWDEKVKAIFDEWDKWTPCDPPPELLEYRKFIDLDDEPPPAAPRPGNALAVDVATAARMLSCGRTLIYELIRTRQLRAVKIGRLTRIPTASLQELIDRKLADPPPLAGSEEEPEWWERLAMGEKG